MSRDDDDVGGAPRTDRDDTAEAASTPRSDGASPAARPALLGLCASAASAPLVYALVRAVEAWREPEPDPAVVLWTERSALLGRLMVVGFVVAIATGGLVAVATRWPGAAPRLVAVLGALAGLAAVAQAVWLP